MRDRDRQAAHDALLMWCSEIGRAPTRAFRAACEHLELRPYDAAWALSALGHIEFDWGDGVFAAASTTMTTIPGLAGRLLLTGARPAGVVADLHDAAQASDLDVDVNLEPCHQFGNGPSTVLVEADPADAQAFCDHAGIAFTPEAHAALGALLPTVRRDTATVAHRCDDRFPLGAVDPHTFRVRWDLADQDAPSDLFTQQTVSGRRIMLLADREHGHRMLLDRAYGPYLMKRPSVPDDADRIIEYQGAHRLLLVSGAAPLPRLHARAACLCSGRLPIRHDLAPGVSVDHYVNVDPATAHAIIASLEGTL